MGSVVASLARNLILGFVLTIFCLTKPTAPLEPYNDAEDLTADLLPQHSELSPSIDLRQFLAHLLTLVTRGRISPRRASVLAYIGNQLLNSRPRSHP